MTDFRRNPWRNYNEETIHGAIGESLGIPGVAESGGMVEQDGYPGGDRIGRGAGGERLADATTPEQAAEAEVGAGADPLSSS